MGMGMGMGMGIGMGIGIRIGNGNGNGNRNRKRNGNENRNAKGLLTLFVLFYPHGMWEILYIHCKCQGDVYVAIEKSTLEK